MANDLVNIQELQQRISQAQTRLDALGAIFDLPKKLSRLQELQVETSRPEFWNDADRAQALSKEQSELTAQIDKLQSLMRSIDDAEVLLQLASDSQDKDLIDEFYREIARIESEVSNFELTRMLSGPHDSQSAILEINSGAGGTEAQDWGEILLRMYMRWAEQHKYGVQLLSVHAGDGAGIKSATLYIEGTNAYGFLRSERGVHRLVRISPFDANARRHTSFASVSVMPDIDQEINVEVRDEDLRVDTYRSSGAGGQHVNKTDSAVRLTHIPTGIVVACQNERSQHKNKATAMKLLKAKLYELEVEKNQKELEQIAGERRKIDFGSQIRNYVLQPYQLVKDVRTGYQSSAVDAILDGDIDGFIQSYLMSEEHNITS
ncbi:MAG: peptide chain release factor 2 [Bdellovibrionota bacterium]